MSAPDESAKALSEAAQNERIERKVAGFYDRLVFPSRTSHHGYRRFLPSEPGEHIADFGCGQSIFYDSLRGYLPSPVFLDLSRNALATIERGHRVCADLRRLPFDDAHYDRVLCIGVLHHLPERRAALAEIARVIRSGGRLFLGVYAPGTLNGRCRRLHDASNVAIWRASVSFVTSCLIQFRHLVCGKVLAPSDVRRRTDDFLKVPFVRYADPAEYVAEAEPTGLRLIGIDRVSAMNVLEFQRTSEGSLPTRGAGEKGSFTARQEPSHARSRTPRR